MKNITQGLFNYIEDLFLNNQLQDSHANQVINQAHKGYCFSLHHQYFIPKNSHHVGNPRLFFHGLKLKEHHLSIEKKQEYHSAIHYTCTLVDQRNPKEYLKLSVFFDSKDFQKITRASYRYLKDNCSVKKGELDLNNPSALDLNRVIFSSATKGNETFTLQQLIDTALSAVTHSRVAKHIKMYQSTILPKIQQFYSYYEEYKKTLLLFEESQFLNLAFGQKALALLEEIIKVLNALNKKVSTTPTISQVDVSYQNIKSQVLFASYDNLEAFQNDYRMRNNHVLVQYFLNNNITPIQDLNTQIQSIFEQAMMSGSIELAQYIYEHFYIKSHSMTLSLKFLELIEENQLPQKELKKLIEVSNYLFENSVSHQNAVIDRLGMIPKLDSDFQIDVFMNMKSSGNILAFVMYLKYAGFLPNFDLICTLIEINLGGKNTKSDDQFIMALNKAKAFKI